MSRKKGIAALLIFMFIAGFSFAQDYFSLNFTNNTGYDIQRIYISPSLSDDWHEDLLGERSVEDGATVSIDVPIIEEGAQYYDILAIDVDEDRYNRFEVDLSSPGERDIVFTFDDFEESEIESSGDESYNQAYLDGYRDAWREAYKEAYSAGYRDGLEDTSHLEGVLETKETDDQE